MKKAQLAITLIAIALFFVGFRPYRSRYAQPAD